MGIIKSIVTIIIIITGRKGEENDVAANVESMFYTRTAPLAWIRESE